MVKCIHVRVLALRRSHAHRAVALQELARIEPLLSGILQVLDLQVFIEVDEILGRGMIDDGKGMRRTTSATDDVCVARGSKSGMCRGARSGARTVGDPRIEVVHPVQAAGRKNAGGQRTRDELLQGIRKARSPAGLQQQIRGRSPSHAHQDAVAFDAPEFARVDSVNRSGPDRDAGRCFGARRDGERRDVERNDHPISAGERLVRCMGPMDNHSRRRALRCGRRLFDVQVGAQVDDGDDSHILRMQAKSGAVRLEVRGNHHDP